ncbi:hypothetical protein RL72_03785 [Microbacterium azadirachtae]|uniref:Uncharacterized protein n=1 Tax=Microbacterium azadirachtae TaxID=582680 RepID=A0A0F0KE34_9MICO|nr:hypothetical protein [Microbacterium azadirachtae]KJL17536.1 hypothetical protein RL72_03785 [Microbacterium azadirachtae]
MATHADDGGADAALARRLQILATEHWGLLAARSTAQSEVLTRITIHLTLVSAGLVTIGLLGQASHFVDWFPVAALGILGFLSAVGLLTLLRVLAVSEEDFMYVTAMNRIRAAYAGIDPGVAAFFLDSVHDDELGMRVTYSFFRHRGAGEQVLGSSSMLSILVNAVVSGMFAGGLCTALGASTPVAVVGGVVVGLCIVAAAVWYAGYRYTSAWRSYEPLSPSEEWPRQWRAVPGTRARLR